MQTTRRQFFKYAGKTALAASSTLGAGQLLGGRRQLDRPYFLIVYCDGGWDQTLVFDNKIDSSTVAQDTGWVAAQTSNGLSYVANTSRPNVSSFFDTHGSRAVIINGLHCRAINHEYARRYALSTPYYYGDARYVDFMSIYADQTARGYAFPHLVFDAPYMPGTLSDTAVYLNNDIIAELTTAIPNTTALGASGEAALTTYLNNTYRDMFKRASYGSLDAKKFWSLYKGYARESALGTALAAAQAAIPVAGTDTDFSRNGKMALELLANDLSQCATIRCGSALQWDTHSNHFTAQSAMFESLFDGLNLILGHAQTLGVYDNLCIVVVSELGRAPTLNANSGKDHWPYTSCMAWGPKLKHGTVVGVTDDYLRGVPISPTFGDTTNSDKEHINIQHVFAGIFFKYGLSRALSMPDIAPLACILEANS